MRKLTSIGQRFENGHYTRGKFLRTLWGGSRSDKCSAGIKYRYSQMNRRTTLSAIARYSRAYQGKAIEKVSGPFMKQSFRFFLRIGDAPSKPGLGFFIRPRIFFL